MSCRDHDALERLSYRAQKLSARSIASQPSVSRLRVNGLDTYPPFFPASARNGTGSNLSTANHSPTIITSSHKASANNNTTTTGSTTAMSPHVNTNNTSGGSNPHYFSHNNNNNNGNLTTTTTTDTKTTGYAPMMELSTPTSPHGAVTLISWLHSPTRRAAFSLVSHPSSPSGATGHNGSVTQTTSLLPPHPPQQPPSSSSLPQHLTSQSLPQSSAGQQSQQQVQQQQPMHGYGPAASVSSSTVTMTTTMTTSSMGWFSGRPATNAIGPTTRSSDLHSPRTGMALQAMSLHSTEGNTAGMAPTTITTSGTAVAHNAGSEAGCRIDFNASDDNVYRFGTSPSLAPSGPGLLLAATSITTHATSITQSEVNEESVQQQQPSSPVLPLLRCCPQGTMALAETYSAASARPVASRTNNNITHSNNMHARARGGMALASCSTTSGVGGSGSAHNYTYNVRVLRSGGTGSAAIPAAPPLTAAVLFGANNNNNNNANTNGETTTTPKTNTSSNNTGMMRGGVPFAWQPVPQPQAFFSASSALSPSFQPSQQQSQPPLSMPISTTTSVTTVTASSPSAVVRIDTLRQPAYMPSVNNSSAGLVMEELISPRPTRLLAPITIPHCDPSKAANVLTTPGSPAGPQEEEKSGNDNGITSLDSNVVDAACPDTTTTTTTTVQQQEREHEEEEVAHEGGTLLVPQSSLHESLIRLMTLDSAGTVEETTATAERKAEEENEARLYADAPTPAHTRALIAQSSQDRHRRVVNANTAANSTTTTTATTTVVRAQSSADTAADTSSHHHHHYCSPAAAATRIPGQSPVCSPLPEFPTFNESLTSASAFTPTSMHASRIYDGIFSASVSGVCGHCAAGHAEDDDCNSGGCCCAHRCLHMPHLCASLHAGAKFELPVMLSLTGRDQLRENDPSEYEALFGTSRTSTMCTTFTRPRHGRRGTALARVIYSMAAKANAAAAAATNTTTTSGGGATRVKSGGGYRRNSHGLHRYVHCVHTTSSNNATRREGSRQLTRTSLAMNNATSFATAASSMTNLNSTLSMGNFYCYYNATPCEAGPEQQRPSHAITTTPAPTQLSSKSQSLFLVGPEQHSVQDKENGCQNGTSGVNKNDNNSTTPGSPHSSHPQAQQSGLRRGSHPNTLQQQQHPTESNNDSSAVAGNGKAYTCDSHAQTHTCGTQTSRAAPQPFSCARIWTTFRPRSADLASRRNSLVKANGHHHNNNSRDTNNNNNGSTSTLSSQLDAGLVLPEPPFTRSGSAVDCDTASRCSTANHNNNHHHQYHRCGRRQSKKAFNKSNGTNDEAHNHSHHLHSSSGDGSPIELADTTSFAMATRMLHSEHSTNGDDDSDAAPRVGGNVMEGPRSRSCYRCTAHSRASRHSHHAEQHVVVLPTQTCLCRHRRSHQQQHQHKPTPGVGNKEDSLLATTITTAGQGKRIRHTTSGSGKDNNNSNNSTSSSTTMSSSEEEEDGNPLGHQVQRHSGGCTLHSHNRSFPRTDSTSAHCLSITSLTSTQSSHLETLEAMYADSMPHAAHTIAPAASLLRHTLSEKSVT